MQTYRTIQEQDDALVTHYEIQKSKFITHLRHVETEEEARAFVQAMKKKYFDARHNCSAWVLGPRGDKQKSNDDGEPGGTAGNPILEAIRKNELTDVVIVVTRYFGGIKLGASGSSAHMVMRPSSARCSHAYRHDTVPGSRRDRRLRPAGHCRTLAAPAGDPPRRERIRRKRHAASAAAARGSRNAADRTH